MAVTDAPPAAVDRADPPSRAARVLRDPRVYLWLIAIAVVAPQCWHQLFLSGDGFVVDLHVYRLSGLDLLHHRPIYSWYYQTETATLPFTYPPISAVLSVPLALLPVRVGAAIWFGAIYLCLAWVLRLVAEPVRARMRVEHPRLEPALLPALWCACTFLVPGIQQIHLGQVGVFLLTLVALDLLTPRTGRWRGVLTGLAAAIKLTPLVFVVVLLAARRVRDAAMCAGSFVVLSALTYAVAPASSVTFWTDTVIHSNRLGNNADPTNQSIRGAILRTTLHGLPFSFVWGVLCLVTLAAGLLVTTRAHRDGDPLLLVTVGGFLSCLLSPVAWIHHYVWIFLFVVWLLRERRPLLAAITLAYWGWNLVGYARVHFLDGGFTGFLWHVDGDLYGIFAFVAVVVLAVRAWRRGDPRDLVRRTPAPSRVAACT